MNVIMEGLRTSGRVAGHGIRQEVLFLDPELILCVHVAPVAEFKPAGKLIRLESLIVAQEQITFWLAEGTLLKTPTRTSGSRRMMVAGRYSTINELAAAEKIDASYIRDFYG